MRNEVFTCSFCGERVYFPSDRLITKVETGAIIGHASVLYNADDMRPHKGRCKRPPVRKFTREEIAAMNLARTEKTGVLA